MLGEDMKAFDITRIKTCKNLSSAVLFDEDKNSSSNRDFIASIPLSF